jgi:hypothetical protein
MDQERKIPLNEWLLRHKHSQSWLARQIGSTRSAVSNYCSGRRKPDRTATAIILELAGGELTYNEIHNYDNENPRFACHQTAPRRQAKRGDGQIATA